MITGTFCLVLFLPESRSLKDKRRVVKSLIERLRQRYNVSVSELGHQGLWQKTAIGISVVNTSKLDIERVFQNIEKLIESLPEVLITERKVEFFDVNS